MYIYDVMTEDNYNVCSALRLKVYRLQELLYFSTSIIQLKLSLRRSFHSGAHIYIFSITTKYVILIINFMNTKDVRNVNKRFLYIRQMI